jgi:hypothetical protein
MTWRFALAMAIAVASAAACTSGSRTIRSEPPGVQLESLRLDGEQARIGLIVHNRNDHPIRVGALRLNVTVAERALIDDRWSMSLEIGPRVRERVRLHTRAAGAGAQRLAALDGRPDANLGYRLRAGIELAGQNDAEQERNGFLHPVPGQPGSYR